VATCSHMKKKRKIRATYPEAEAQALEIKEAATSYGIECEVVNVREARDQLSNLLDRAAKGERIVITSDGTPKAMIVRYRPIIRGVPWSSKKHILVEPLIIEDSTPFIRAERDSGY
jgi:prevent-host-death family protein